jgi:hypothetical protein
MAAGDAEQARAMTCSAAVLARLFGVSKTAIQSWVAAGMPQASPREYNVSACLVWRRERDREIASASDGTLTAERRRLIAEQRRGHELANARAAEALLPAEDVRRDMSAYQRILDGALDALVDDATADLAGVTDPAEARRLLAVRCRAARVSLATQFAEYGRGLGGDDDGATG